MTKSGYEHEPSIVFLSKAHDPGKFKVFAEWLAANIVLSLNLFLDVKM